MEGPLRRHLHVTAMADLHAMQRELRACVHEGCAEVARPDRSNELRAGPKRKITLIIALTTFTELRKIEQVELWQLSSWQEAKVTVRILHPEQHRNSSIKNQRSRLKQ